MLKLSELSPKQYSNHDCLVVVTTGETTNLIFIEWQSLELEGI